MELAVAQPILAAGFGTLAYYEGKEAYYQAQMGNVMEATASGGRGFVDLTFAGATGRGAARSLRNGIPSLKAGIGSVYERFLGIGSSSTGKIVGVYDMTPPNTLPGSSIMVVDGLSTAPAQSSSGSATAAARCPVSLTTVTRTPVPIQPNTGSQGVTTPNRFFGSRTYSQVEKALTTKYGPPRGQGPYNKSFYNPKTKRTFNLHHDPAHRGGRPHVDVRKRGLPTGYYKDRPNFLLDE